MADAIIYKSQQIKSVEFRSMRVLLALLHTALRELRFLRAALACSHSRPGRRSEQAGSMPRRGRRVLRVGVCNIPVLSGPVGRAEQCWAGGTVADAVL